MNLAAKHFPVLNTNRHRISHFISRCFASNALNNTIYTTSESNKPLESFAKEVSHEDMPIEMENPYYRRKNVCILCKYGIELDYKNPKLLSQFVSPFTGQLYDIHITRLCRNQHKKLKLEIDKSRSTGFMPVMVKSVEFLKDPQLFDPNNPIKPHKY